MPIATPADREDYEQWLRLYLVRGVSARLLTQLLAVFKSPEAALAASASELTQHVGKTVAHAIKEGPSADDVEAHLTWLEKPYNHFITLAEPDYPQSLLLTADPPPVLFGKGRRELLQNTNVVGVVGSRNATPQGERDAAAFAKTLSQAGVTIASGLALGIDAAAHRGALDALGMPGMPGMGLSTSLIGGTIAVIGTGLDRIYPARNAALAREIAEKGLILSEFYLGTPPLKENFPRRNRIISGLSKGILVVEAAINSGSLITARLAGEQGRDVFAIPGSIHSPVAKGCHSLIKSGAKLVEAAEDILSELNLERPKTSLLQQVPTIAEHSEEAADLVAPESNGLAAKILAVIGAQSLTLDQICEQTAEPIHIVMAEVTTLELLGKVATSSGGRIQQLF